MCYYPQTELRVDALLIDIGAGWLEDSFGVVRNRKLTSTIISVLSCGPSRLSQCISRQLCTSDWLRKIRQARHQPPQ